MSSNVDLVRGIYAAFAAGDVPRVLASFHDDIIWNEAENFPYADLNPYVGPQAILHGVFARCAGEWDGFAVEVSDVFDAGSTVITTGEYHGRYKATGRAQRTQFCHIWWLRAGKVARFQQHADTLHVARVIGAV